MATPLTVKQVELLGGETALAALSSEDAALVIGVVEKRLLGALCRTEAPTEEDPNYDLWLTLLSRAVVTFESVRDASDVVSEKVRNYSYTLRSDAGTWDDLGTACGDLLALFSECKGGVDMQFDVTFIQYGVWGIPADWPVGGAV